MAGNLIKLQTETGRDSENDREREPKNGGIQAEFMWNLLEQ